MENILFLTVTCVTFFLTGCNTSDKPDNKATATVDSVSTNVDAKLLPCRHTGDVDITMANPTLLTFDVNKTNGTITILYNGICKQILQPGDNRTWAVYNSSGTLHFKDSPSATTLAYGYPVFTMPFKGNFGHELKFLSCTPGIACPYILIGTDDYRDFGYRGVKYNIYNSSTTINNYVNLTIGSTVEGGVTTYSLFIKHNGYSASAQPDTCNANSCSQTVCKTAATGTCP